MMKLFLALLIATNLAVLSPVHARAKCAQVMDETKFKNLGGRIVTAFQPAINTSFCSGSDCKAQIELEGTIYQDGHVDNIVVAKNAFRHGAAAWAKSAVSIYRYTKFVPPKLGNAPICVRHTYIFSLN